VVAGCQGTDTVARRDHAILWPSSTAADGSPVLDY
jgi:hypothetical protein